MIDVITNQLPRLKIIHVISEGVCVLVLELGHVWSNDIPYYFRGCKYPSMP